MNIPKDRLADIPVEDLRLLVQGMMGAERGMIQLEDTLSRMVAEGHPDLAKYRDQITAIRTGFCAFKYGEFGHLFLNSIASAIAAHHGSDAEETRNTLKEALRHFPANDAGMSGRRKP